MVSEPSDTFTWLLTRADACPACGAELPPTAPGCGACGRSLLVLYRPPQRSNTAKALAGAWLIGGMGALLALIGTLAQVLGLTKQTNSDLILRALLVGSTLAGLFCAAMTWACLERRPGALYVGMGLAAALGAGGFAAGLLLRGPLGLGLATGCVFGALALVLMHLSVMREFRGELRRLSYASGGASARGLARQGREHLIAGLPFAAAQCWARALGKEPGNAEYLHALGLALARLGEHRRAAAQIERALAIDPGNAEYQRSLAIVREHLHN